MSDEGSGDVFEVGRVRELIELMIEHGLTEVDLRQHGQTIRLRRGGETPVVYPAYSAMAPMPQVGASPPMGGTQGGPSSGLGAEESDIVVIRSPMVGTFYSRPGPDTEAFVKVGQDISVDTTVCIIEAMKVFNPIAAEIAGKIVAVLVENEEPVEYGKPLFKVRPVK